MFEVGQGRTERPARLDDVVHPRAHGDQIGLHRQGLRDLLGQDVGNPFAADRQVGVVQSRVERVDHDGEPVGESEKTDDVVTVPQAFGLTVPDGDVTAISRRNSPEHEAENSSDRGPGVVSVATSGGRPSRSPRAAVSGAGLLGAAVLSLL
ncbi:hypothetical protein GCM10023161_36180 [Mycobacterium paraffinicum]|uniref:Uncharacterized protein n=1 Tax=Mycobacterium paraffinicum TaxID=53378 RepID=A0ABP8F0E1_9MYCO